MYFIINHQTTWANKHPLCFLKGFVGDAVDYSLKQWVKLNAYIAYGHLELDNNRSERSIKLLLTGRKNWLFANTLRGAQSSAMIYSVVETAKENSLNPYVYIKCLLEQLPNIDIKDQGALNQLLPWSGNLPAQCRNEKVDNDLAISD